MKLFGNLFKSHTQKRIEARRREEEAWRAAQRSAGGDAGPGSRNAAGRAADAA